MKRLCIIGAILTTLCLMGCASCGTTALKARDICGLPSLQEVLPGVYAGDFGDAMRLDALQEHGITYILNVAKEIGDPDWSSKGITQAKAGLVDWNDPDNEAKVKAAVDCLDRWYGSCPKKSDNSNILVHCEGGRNRTLYVLSRWWARRTGGNWKDVATQIQKVRPEMALHGWMYEQMGDRPW